MSATKKCSTCGLEKNLNEFYNAKRRKDGKQSRCKSCQNPTHGKRQGPTAEVSQPAQPAPRQAQPGEWGSIYGGQVCAKCGGRYWGQQCQACLARIQHVFDGLRLFGTR